MSHSKRKKGNGRTRSPKPKTELEIGRDRELMTVREVASYLNCHYMTVYKLVRTGDLPAFRLGSDWRFRRSDLEKWIAKKQVRPARSGPKARKQKPAAKKPAPRKERSWE